MMGMVPDHTYQPMLLVGGDESTQHNDIATAIELARNFQEWRALGVKLHAGAAWGAVDSATRRHPPLAPPTLERTSMCRNIKTLFNFEPPAAERFGGHA